MHASPPAEAYGKSEARRKDRKLSPPSDVVIIDVPAIIDQETFDAVRAHIKARNPKTTPPQVVGGPTLLTGVIHCAKCGGAMNILTGRGGRYRYYICSTKARRGPTACAGMTVPIEKLDDFVAGHLEERLLQPARLEAILSNILDRGHEKRDRNQTHIAELNKCATGRAAAQQAL